MYGLVLIGTFNNELKKHSVSKIILTFHCSNELFQLCDLKNFVSSRSSALNLQKIFSITSTIFFTIGQNNFGNKIPIKFLKSIFHFDRKVKHFQKWYYFVTKIVLTYCEKKTKVRTIFGNRMLF